MHAFMLSLTTGAALLAAWLVVRFPRAIPVTGRAITVSLVGAAVVVEVVPQTIVPLGSSLGGTGAILLIALPSLTYLFLVVAWIMLFVRRALGPHIR